MGILWKLRGVDVRARRSLRDAGWRYCPIGIVMAALVGAAAIAAFAQSPAVLTGAAAYGDWRNDAPGVRRKITPADMPQPYATPSVDQVPSVVARPDGAWPTAPPGFVVELFASGLDNP